MAKAFTLAVLSVLFLFAAAPSAAAFSDVPADHWCAGPIGQMAAEGFVAGYADGTFRPANPVTAAQFVTIVGRCAGLDEKIVPQGGQGGNRQGAQNAGTHWAAETMEAALEAGWYDWDELPPTGERYDQPLARVLAVKILMRALLPAVRGDWVTETAKISDFAQLDGRYYESVQGAYAAGVVQGDSAGRFNPHGGLTRAAACALVYRALQAAEGQNNFPGGAGQNPSVQNPPDTIPAPPEPVTPAPANPFPAPGVPAARGGVKENGWLQVKGTQLCNEAGEPVVLRGMSSHGIQWYGQFASASAIGNTAAWGANLFRIAMYTAEGGWLSNPTAIEKQVYAAADAAIAQNLYVILDWHILSDGNPQTHADQAAAFFARAAERYKDSPAVLYEICNEPNGDVTWERDIKPYAERMVSVIREKSPKAVILIGSGTWSQDIHTAAASPVEGDNLMYTFHFYAGTHGADLQNRLRTAVSGGLPVFVTEWGTSRADGGGGVFPDAAKSWLDLLDELGVSWANWSLCDKNEASAALKPGTGPDKTWTEADFSESGKLVFSRLRGTG